MGPVRGRRRVLASARARARQAACLSNLSAGLTHYGTTPSPMFYAHGYVSFQDWWKVGFLISVVNLAIWCSAGFLWWKIIGLW